VGTAEREEQLWNDRADELEENDAFGDADTLETRNEDHGSERKREVQSGWDYVVDFDGRSNAPVAAQAAPAKEAALVAPADPAAEEEAEAAAAEAVGAQAVEVVERVEEARQSQTGMAHDQLAQRSAQLQARRDKDERV